MAKGQIDNMARTIAELRERAEAAERRAEEAERRIETVKEVAQKVTRTAEDWADRAEAAERLASERGEALRAYVREDEGGTTPSRLRRRCCYERAVAALRLTPEPERKEGGADERSAGRRYSGQFDPEHVTTGPSDEQHGRPRDSTPEPERCNCPETHYLPDCPVHGSPEPTGGRDG